MIAGRTAPGWVAAAAAADVLASEDVDYLIIAARGTSDNAARYAQYLLGTVARLPVGLAAPWLYTSSAPPLLRRGAVLAISQSGRSPDIRSVLAAARAQGRPAVALTNDIASPLAEDADVVVPLGAGDERSVRGDEDLSGLAARDRCRSPRVFTPNRVTGRGSSGCRRWSPIRSRSSSRRRALRSA